MSRTPKTSLKIKTASLSSSSETDGRSSPKSSKIFKVSDQIFIGGYSEATDMQRLKELQITDIINCSPDNCPNIFVEKFRYYDYQLFDSPCFDILITLQIILQLIVKLRNEGAKIFIHCFQGISRAPSIAIAYLIFYEQKSVDEALGIIKEKYSKAEPNIGFILQLEELYEQRKQNDPSEFGIDLLKIDNIVRV